jgi:hypothetical protein
MRFFASVRSSLPLAALGHRRCKAIGDLYAACVHERFEFIARVQLTHHAPLGNWSPLKRSAALNLTVIPAIIAGHQKRIQSLHQNRFHNGAKSRQLCCVLIYVPDSIWHPECDGSPHSILFRHSNNEFFELFLGARSTWTTLVVTVVFLCNQLSLPRPIRYRV